MKKVVIALFVVACIIGVTLLFTRVLNSKSEESEVSQPTVSTQQEVTDTADFVNKPTLIIGNAQAPVKLIEYIDYKCPSCNRFHRGAGDEIMRSYVDTGKVAIEIRNYPFLGPDSGRAARGAYCADDQGLFPTYHDRVYDYVWDTYYSTGDLDSEFKDVLTSEVLLSVLADQNLDVEKFRSCIDSTDYNRFIDADLLLGAEDGANGTPTFVINDQTIVGPQSFSTFKTLIEIGLR